MQMAMPCMQYHVEHIVLAICKLFNSQLLSIYGSHIWMLTEIIIVFVKSKNKQGISKASNCSIGHHVKCLFVKFMLMVSNE